MPNVGNILLDKEILLESGTNELEVLVFSIADYTFGINVAKVREVLKLQPITSLPRAHSSVRGVFKLRNSVIPCVSLYEHLQLGEASPQAESTMILTDFNRQQTAFLVDGVERIHRLSWEQILGVPPIMSLNNTPVTAVARCDERLIVLLDFEMIIDQVTGALMDAEAIENPLEIPRHQLKIVLADDSPTVRKGVTKTLAASGYTQLQYFENGAAAWNWLESQVRETGRAHDVADLVISDIEMPQVDGFHLTKKIKDHPVLGCLPVLLYSSIVTPDNDKKGKAVGADAQIAKPELHRIVEMADSLISASRPEFQQAAAKPAASAAENATKGLAAEKPASDTKPQLAIPPAAAKPTPMTSGGTGDPELWASFRTELREHLPLLQQSIDSSEGNCLNEKSIKELARRLHTIKAAAMVVPVDAIVRVTHLVESLLGDAAARNDGALKQAISKYAGWLQALAEATHNGIGQILEEAPTLEIDLAESALAATK